MQSLEQRLSLPLSAVFVDVENMAVSGPGGLAAFDIGRVMTHVESSSRPILRRAYANWAKLRTFRGPLLRHAFDQIQATYMNQSKNGLDIQMSLDALETSLTDSRIELFYLVTADSDFGPLARALRRHGRMVVGLGWREKTNDIFRRHCDLYVNYDDLPGDLAPSDAEPPRAPSPVERRARPQRPERPERRVRPGISSEATDELFLHDPRYDASGAGDPEPSAVPFLSEPRPTQRAARPPRRPIPQTRQLDELNRGIAALVDEQGPSARLNPSQFQRAIRRIDPGFTPMAFGFGSLPEFVDAHPLLSRSETDGGPHVIVLPDAEALAAAEEAAERNGDAMLDETRQWVDDPDLEPEIAEDLVEDAHSDPNRDDIDGALSSNSDAETEFDGDEEMGIDGGVHASSSAVDDMDAADPTPGATDGDTGSDNAEPEPVLQAPEAEPDAPTQTGWWSRG